MSYPSFIHAPEGTKYLKEIFDDGLLPQNCVFDKVLTGSYVALTSPEPYIIAVPTKALATTLGKWYLLKRTTKEGVTCYRIIQRLTDTLVN